ncbi:hypothetical protein P879_01977 [Paragonimus westermani]|uniref:Uncharacterized protein n=1 Tax=Paragonimus westermani TaxID=34504 RepID=A0A8T0DNL2_9TREM|nr:hypothetical protein P879_01977 [Paragonimus westermani]
MVADELGREMPTDNQVAEDLIWKGHCIAEQRSVKTYRSKWGFLKGPMENFVKEDFDQLVDKKRVNWRDLIQNRVEEPEPPSKYISVLPSPKPVPSTTAGMIGWRAVNSQNWLDRYGRHGRPRVDIFKQLNWPADVPM